MSYAFNSPPKITPAELEPGHGLMPKKQGSAQPDLRDEIARLTAERDDWARKAMEWRRKYAELRYPGMTNEVYALGVPVTPPEDWQIFSFLERVRDDFKVPPEHRRLAASLHQQFANAGVKTGGGKR